MIKKLLGIVSLGILSLAALYFCFEAPEMNNFFTAAFNRRLLKSRVLIFAGSTYFGVDYTRQAGHQFYNPCPMEDYCRMTSNASELHLADAVLYHNRDFNGTMFKTSVPQVMYTAESPVHESIRYKPGTINWTMTFRRDSEIYAPYGFLVKSDTAENVDFESLWAGKDQSLTSSWMASNCVTGNKRMQLIKKAQSEGLEIDIFGGCGKPMHRCSRSSKNHYQCAADVLSKYKFYFAFENSNCLDYVTEKFWNTLSLYKAVPIVIERMNIEHLGVPRNAFIALDDFPTVKDMVDFINKLKHDKERYLGYHKWRLEYRAKSNMTAGLCKLCRRLREPILQSHTYENLADWFSSKTCNNSYAFHYL